MHPLKILAALMAAAPAAAFAITLVLTDGAPLKPFTPGEESVPVAAAPHLPQTPPERQGSAEAAGHVVDVSSANPTVDGAPLVERRSDHELPGLVNAERDAWIFSTLFGNAREPVPHGQ